MWYNDKGISNWVPEFNVKMAHAAYPILTSPSIPTLVRGSRGFSG